MPGVWVGRSQQLLAKVYQTLTKSTSTKGSSIGMAQKDATSLPMANKNNTRTQTHIRDSKTGEFIPQRVADRKDPATWERERIKYPKK